MKQHNGYGSLGMTKRSRVEDGTALRREVALMCDAFREALIEEFVEGEELTVLVVEDPDDRFHPRALRPAMYQFPPGETFKHQSVKWDLGAQGQFVPCQDEALSANLKQIGQRIFTLLGLRGYARCDFRVDRSGVPQFLECNPNCGIFYPEETWGCADAILASDPLGHRGMLDLMIRARSLDTQSQSLPGAEHHRILPSPDEPEIVSSQARGKGVRESRSGTLPSRP